MWLAPRRGENWALLGIGGAARVMASAIGPEAVGQSTGAPTRVCPSAERLVHRLFEGKVEREGLFVHEGQDLCEVHARHAALRVDPHVGVGEACPRQAAR